MADLRHPMFHPYWVMCQPLLLGVCKHRLLVQIYMIKLGSCLKLFHGVVALIVLLPCYGLVTGIGKTGSSFARIMLTIKQSFSP